MLPSLRLKVTRDALEDLALMRCARERLEAGGLPMERAQRLRALLDPTPEVFVSFHYFDADPGALLRHRSALLEALADG